MGNPEDRFCRVTAQIVMDFWSLYMECEINRNQNSFQKHIQATR